MEITHFISGHHRSQDAYVWWCFGAAINLVAVTLYVNVPKKWSRYDMS